MAVRSSPEGSAARSVEVVGDRGAWALHPAQLWPALADPRRRSPLPVPGDDEPAERHVEHWAPLVALTFGALGWARPDVGVARWLTEGSPADGGALDLVAGWYGQRAAGLVAWSRASTAISDHACRLSEQLGLPVPAARAPLAVCAETFDAFTRGGPDALQLGRVVDQMIAPTDDPGRLFTGPDGDGTAVLLLDRHAGWYRVLTERGRTLPLPPQGRTWAVDVVVRSIGSLGVYRRSPMTGRWTTATEAVHLLGWPAAR